MPNCSLVASVTDNVSSQEVADAINEALRIGIIMLDDTVMDGMPEERSLELWKKIQVRPL